MQRPRRGDGGIELAQAACRGIARVGEELLAGGGLPLVDGGEIRMRQIDLAAHFERVRHILSGQLLRNVADGTGVGRDILADGTIAARGRAHEPALLVAQAERQTVDLRLRREDQRRLGLDLQEAPDALDELLDLASSANALARESIGTRCRILENFSDAFDPTFWVRLSSELSSGNCASNAS